MIALVMSRTLPPTMEVHCAFCQLLLPDVVQGAVRHNNPPGLTGRDGDALQLFTYWAQKFPFPLSLVRKHSPDRCRGEMMVVLGH